VVRGGRERQTTLVGSVVLVEQPNLRSNSLPSHILK